MSLASEFDAAALGHSLKRSATPMKMLPVHNPPKVMKKTIQSSHDCSGPRRLIDDTWLNDIDSQTCLGRVFKETVAHGNTPVPHTIIETFCGNQITIQDDGVVLHGIHNKENIKGHVVVKAAQPLSL